MKRKAFTLIELLTVVAIILLLLAITAPSVTTAVAIARSTICKNNLGRLSEAFVLSRDGKTNTADAGPLYPRPMTWPGIPNDTVTEEKIFQCPEDEVQPSVAGSMKDVEYVSPYGAFSLETVGEGACYKSRRGSDRDGSYTEFLMQDDYGTGGQYALMDFNGWIDTDGGCRIYDSGVILIFSHLPPTPDSNPPWGPGRGPGWPDRMNTCGNLNSIYYKGEPAFGSAGRMQNVRGQSIQLANWGNAITNYGINSEAHWYTGGGGIVLVDYSSTIVNIDAPVLCEEQLLESARHLGKVNYLTAGGSVKTATPMAISPRLQPGLWQP